MARSALIGLLIGASAAALSGCGQKRGESPQGEAADRAISAAVPADGNWPVRAYFGDTHVHTGWSADAGIDGAVLGPEDAFRFARGDEVTSNSGQKAKLNRPLDWMVITDHSDGMGTINEIRDGNPEMIGNDEFLKRMNAALKSSDVRLRNIVMLEAVSRQVSRTLPKAMMDPKWMISAWKRTIEIADRYNEPGKFTALIGYEWTVNADDGNNLHRNVVLRDGASKAGKVLPLTTFETQNPEGLWKWMADYEAKIGGKALAIPHNGNLSNGRMFEATRFDRSPMTRDYAIARQRWEPLFEVTQIKGQSESHPSLSPNDEFASWDLWDRGNLDAVPKKPGMIRTEYWREALKSGLRLQGALGTNPFKYGANAGTDTHTGLSAAEENNFWGKLASLEPGPDRLQRPFNKQFASFDMVAAGYMGVWATANTREALWDAMQRRETFATTGPRMTVRFFGGFDFADADVQTLVKSGYTKGVPMGADLKPAPAGKAPAFLIAAMKDPDGANLDRVQVVKGWVDAAGQTHEQIFDVKWAGDRKPGANGKLPPVGNTVDTATATYKNSIGAGELVTLWRDPAFDPKQRAVYYVRVLEIPTPRWNAYDQVRYKVTGPKAAPLVHQERAFTSPIWYTPA